MLVKETSKFFKSSEEVVSAFLGLVIVVVVVGLIFNFIQRQKGNISVPGISSNKVEEKVDTEEGKGGIENNKAPEENEKLNYVVKKGDSLWKIAENVYGNGFEWKKIATGNNLKNPRLLAAGTTLTIETKSKIETSTIL